MTVDAVATVLIEQQIVARSADQCVVAIATEHRVVAIATEHRVVASSAVEHVGASGRIGLYKRSCFVLEAKQGSEQKTGVEEQDAELVAAPKKQKRGTAVRGTKGWDDAMCKARGHTRELAERLARLVKSLEGAKDEHGQPFDPARVAQFLMRCLFTMFAENVDLLPRGSFTELLKSLRSDIATLPQMLRSLWESMDKGGFSPILRKKLSWFNGGLFEDCEALPLREAQLDLLIEASQANWRDVEPAIFGTLLERALAPVECHKLGAHFTPRASVERLVLPTIIEPLRAEWDAVLAAARGECRIVTITVIVNLNPFLAPPIRGLSEQRISLLTKRTNHDSTNCFCLDGTDGVPRDVSRSRGTARKKGEFIREKIGAEQRQIRTEQTQFRSRQITLARAAWQFRSGWKLVRTDA